MSKIGWCGNMGITDPGDPPEDAPSNFQVGALKARLADKDMPWTRAHVEGLISQIEQLTKQRDEGWNAFYALRKHVAEQNHPGMTKIVHAHSGAGDPPDFWEQDERDSEDDSPYCECQLEATEDEDAENQCACCGKPLQ